MHICIQMLSLLYVMWYIAELHPNISGAASSHSTVARSRLFSGLFFKIIKSRNSYIHVLFAQLARKLRVTLNNKIAFAANTAIKDGHLAFYPQQWGFWGISSFHAGTELF